MKLYRVTFKSEESQRAARWFSSKRYAFGFFHKLAGLARTREIHKVEIPKHLETRPLKLARACLNGEADAWPAELVRSITL